MMALGCDPAYRVLFKGEENIRTGKDEIKKAFSPACNWGLYLCILVQYIETFPLSFSFVCVFAVLTGE